MTEEQKKENALKQFRSTSRTNCITPITMKYQYGMMMKTTPLTSVLISGQWTFLTQSIKDCVSMGMGLIVRSLTRLWKSGTRGKQSCQYTTERWRDNTMSQLFHQGQTGKSTFLSLFLFPISLVQNTHKYFINNNL